jgi:hypothetical protein
MPFFCPQIMLVSHFSLCCLYTTLLILWLLYWTRLGSGLGLCGILSYHLKASEVLMTDSDIHMLHNFASQRANQSTHSL